MAPAIPYDSMIRSLDAAVAETIETMFFAEAAVGTGSRNQPEGMRTIVEFRGDACGYLELRLSGQKARELAANFLGLETPQVSEIQVESVCGEMANMICGAMVSIAAPEGHFVLKPPTVLTHDSRPVACPVVRHYELDLDRLEVGLHCITPGSGGH